MKAWWISFIILFAMSASAQTQSDSVRNEVLSEQTMSEVTIKATKVLLFTDGDTIVYNADMFHHENGSMLKNLIIGLPGVKLDNNGQIWVNGEFVDALLVNGREFFHGDSNVALQNLPSYTVKNVKVYHQAPENAYLTRDDSVTKAKKTDPLIMDVRLKKEYSDGWLANIDAAGGLKTTTNDGAYYGRLFALYFNDLCTIGAYASANNQSETSVLNGRGWSEGKMMEGEFRSATSGVTLNGNNRNKEMSYYANLRFEHSIMEDLRLTSSTTFLPTGNWNSRMRNDINRHYTSIIWNGGFKYKGRFFFLQVVPHVWYSFQNQGSALYSASFQKEMTEKYRGEIIDRVFFLPGGPIIDSTQVNDIHHDERQKQKYLMCSNKLKFNVKSPLTGRVLEISANGSYYKRLNNSNKNSWYLFSNDKKQSRFEDTQTDVTRKSYSNHVELNYPILNKREGKNVIMMNVQYIYNQEYSNDNQVKESFYQSGEKLEVEQGILPSYDYLQRSVDYQNSFHTAEHKSQNTINVDFSIRLPNEIMLQLSLPVKQQRSRINDYRNHTEKSINRTDWLLCPQINLGYKSLSAHYGFNNTIPDLLMLLDIRDSTDPMCISVGNPLLNNWKEHSVNINYIKFFPRHLSNVSCRLSYNKVVDAIGVGTFVNKQTGVFTSMPKNVDGNWNSSLSVEHERMLDEKNRWNLNTNTTMSYVNSVDYISDGLQDDDNSRQMVGNLSFHELFRLDYRNKGFTIGVKTNLQWTNATSHRDGFKSLNYIDLNYGGYASCPILKNLELSTEITMNSRFGYGSDDINDNNLIWNMSASYSFGKKKQWTMKAIGFDILQQISHVSHFVNAQGKTETWYKASSSYAIIHLIYCMNIKPKKDNRQRIE